MTKQQALKFIEGLSGYALHKKIVDYMNTKESKPEDVKLICKVWIERDVFFVEPDKAVEDIEEVFPGSEVV